MQKQVLSNLFQQVSFLVLHVLELSHFWSSLTSWVTHYLENIEKVNFVLLFIRMFVTHF